MSNNTLISHDLLFAVPVDGKSTGYVVLLEKSQILDYTPIAQSINYLEDNFHKILSESPSNRTFCFCMSVGQKTILDETCEISTAWRSRDDLKAALELEISQGTICLGNPYLDSQDSFVGGFISELADIPRLPEISFLETLLNMAKESNSSLVPFVIKEETLIADDVRTIYFGLLLCDISLVEELQRSAVTHDKKPKNQKERLLEDELQLWLVANGIFVERQVATKNHHRIDLWIPGKLMLELKAGKVNGEDVCQAVSYYTAYRKPIVLVGESIHPMAIRGIESINALVGSDQISFVTWGAIKPYIKGVITE